MSSGPILILGGAGFLGAHLVDEFRRSRRQVRVFDIAAQPDWALEDGVEYIRGDLRDEELTRKALEGVDTVIHAAFATPRQHRNLIEDVNTGGTRIVCENASASGVQRFILISSTIVTRAPRAHPLFSNSPLTRLDVYRSSRERAEQIALRRWNGKMQVAIVRPKTFVGPGYLSAFAIVFEWIRLGRPVPILGDGEIRYQLVHVSDMAEGIRLLADSSATGIFYFGAQEFGTVREELESLFNHAGTGSRLFHVPQSLARAGLRAMELANIIPLSEWHYKIAHGEDSVVDISRTIRELSWRPRRSNAQALTEAYDWYAESVSATGTARSKFPVPLTHRALKYFTWLLPH